MHELRIVGGVVHDGLGSPGLRADVAIDADRVVAVGVDMGRRTGRSTLAGGSLPRASSMRTPIPTRSR